MSTTESATLTQVGDIQTIQQMWDAAVEYFEQKGYNDILTMSNLYARMDSQMTYQDIANVCSGVYANTYWNRIKVEMDSSILSKNLQKALGITAPAADQIAQAALSQWRGVLSRKNSSDTGSIPTQYPYNDSIDLVCTRDKLIAPTVLINNWDKSYWERARVGKNYVCVRCANVQFKNPIPNVTAQMFYTEGGFNQSPKDWLQCKTTMESTTGKITTLEGVKPLGVDGSTSNRGVSEPFVLEPTNNKHICVVAALSSTYFENNPRELHPVGNWNATIYITHCGALAWRNADPQISLEDSLVFYNQDSTPELFEFVASCRNVPVGSKITLSVDDPAINFDATTTAVEHSSQTIRRSLTLPGDYKGHLNVRLEDPDGNMLSSSAAVEIRMHWVLPPGHERYEEAAALPSHLLALSPDNHIGLFMGSYTLLGGQGA